MHNMSLLSFKRFPEGRSLGNMLVVLVVILLIGSLIVPSFTALADEDEEDEVEAPEWTEGDRWRYSDRIPMPGEPGPDPGDDEYLETIVDMEVTDEKFRVNAHGPGGEEETYETYQVREIHNPDADDPQERFEADFYYWKENLAQIYNDPKDHHVPSAYHPPIVELDFPLYVGKEWSTDMDHEMARYFEDPPDIADLDDDEDYPEPDREYAYLGRVENKTTIEVDLNTGPEEFETYMVNLTVLALEEDEDQAQLNRYELYYSPEVKNTVHTEIFEVRGFDEEDLGGADEYLEAPVGNETLMEYEATAYEPNDERGESLLGVGIVLVIIGVGTASFIVYKKVRKSV